MSETSGNWEEAVAWLRDQPGKEDLIRDAYFDEPLIEAAERYRRSNEWHALRGLFGRKSGAVLDVGAGRGISSYAFAKDGFDVTALEPDRSALVGSGAVRDLAAEAGLAIDVVDTFSQPLPFDDASFDIVFARAVLHHIDDLDGALREFHRILRKGGRLIAIREHVLSKDEDLPLFLAAHPLHHRYGGENAFTVDRYVAAIEGAGFTIAKLLGPWDSAANYGPQTLRELFAKQVKLPVLPSAIAALIANPITGPAVRALLNRVDNRPGRHYAFVANKAS